VFFLQQISEQYFSHGFFSHANRAIKQPAELSLDFCFPTSECFPMNFVWFSQKACSHQDSTLDLKSPGTPFVVFVDQLVQSMFLFVY
jgi:hypothetical protein